jgi:hypothetical protein
VKQFLLKFLVIILFLFCSARVNATASTEDPASDTQESPWMAVPLISSNPKVGTSGGGMAGYLFKLDAGSTSSMLGIGGTYSTTDSAIGGLFLRAFRDDDSKRLTAVAGSGKIENDYEDFLGTGLPAQTTDNLKVFQIQYMQEVSKGWFAGIQGIYTNYLISSEDFLTQEILKALGLTGVDSAGLGLVAMYDDRDNLNLPNSGHHLMINNFAYREAFGGEEDFDTWNAEYKQYIPHGDGNVLAFRLKGRWTSDASPGGYSSVNLRGYVRGQYLAPHSTLIEMEARRHIKGRYGMNFFAGVACLYGDDLSCSDSGNVYPAAGIGGQIVIKESEKMVMTFDYAKGEGSNEGFYMRFGQSF